MGETTQRFATAGSRSHPRLERQGGEVELLGTAILQLWGCKHEGQKTIRQRWDRSCHKVVTVDVLNPIPRRNAHHPSTPPSPAHKHPSLLPITPYSCRSPKSTTWVNFKDCFDFSLHALKTAPRTGLWIQHRLFDVDCQGPSVHHLLPNSLKIENWPDFGLEQKKPKWL